VLGMRATSSSGIVVAPAKWPVFEGAPHGSSLSPRSHRNQPKKVSVAIRLRPHMFSCRRLRRLGLDSEDLQLFVGGNEDMAVSHDRH
jgi:hypothetical protein